MTIPARFTADQMTARLLKSLERQRNHRDRGAWPDDFDPPSTLDSSAAQTYFNTDPGDNKNDSEEN